LDDIINFLIYTGKCSYTILPGVAANIAPMLVSKINFLNYPVDFGFQLNSQPVFGKNKTYRGLLFAILFSIITIQLQYLIFKYTSFKDLTLYDFNSLNIYFFGFLFGFGGMAGDLVKSFFKRRLNIDPGKSFIPWDQIDCAIGGLLFGRIVWAYSLKFAIVVIFITFFLHIFIRFIAYYSGLNKTKW
jgi:CDP-2,3-bis-(O-geranylgeranyl)-sn-glycerol synthase